MLRNQQYRCVSVSNVFEHQLRLITGVNYATFQAKYIYVHHLSPLADAPIDESGNIFRFVALLRIFACNGIASCC